MNAARPDVYAALTRVATAAPGLQMLVLHGSRARNEAHAQSDWDFAYEADSAFDVDALLAAFAEALHADRIDLVDLDRAGALMRTASRATASCCSSGRRDGSIGSG